MSEGPLKSLNKLILLSLKNIFTEMKNVPGIESVNRELDNLSKSESSEFDKVCLFVSDYFSKFSLDEMNRNFLISSFETYVNSKKDSNPELYLLLEEELKKMKITRNPDQNTNIDDMMYVLILALLNSNKRSFYYLLLRYCTKSAGAPIAKIFDSCLSSIPKKQKEARTPMSEIVHSEEKLNKYIQRLELGHSGSERTKTDAKPLLEPREEGIAQFISEISKVLGSSLAQYSLNVDDQMKNILVIAKTCLEKYNEMLVNTSKFAETILTQLKQFLFSHIDVSIQFLNDKPNTSDVKSLLMNIKSYIQGDVTINQSSSDITAATVRPGTISVVVGGAEADIQPVTNPAVQPKSTSNVVGGTGANIQPVPAPVPATTTTSQPVPPVTKPPKNDELDGGEITHQKVFNDAAGAALDATLAKYKKLYSRTKR